MVAVVTGAGAGLVNSSKDVLGSAGELGNAATGRSGERVTVNAANGNLIVQDRDEYLVGIGPDVDLLRTYNSQGSWDGDNNDNWRLGYYRWVWGVNGTVNTVGSSIRRTEADGHIATYWFNASQNKYFTGEGPGIYDALSYDSGTNTWTWTDGDTGIQETYAFANSNSGGTYRLTKVLDTDGNSVGVDYSGLQISRLSTFKSGSSTASEWVDLVYAGNQISQVRTTYLDVQGQVKTRSVTTYTYDNVANRLTKVSTDLTPDNANDNAFYNTSYTYDANGRLWTLQQSDGTKLTFTYTSDGRVDSVTDDNGTTKFGYDSVNRVTTITDALNQVTTLKYTAGYGLLSEVSGAAVGGDGFKQTYTYNSENLNLATSTNAKGETTTYEYNGSGGLVRRTDAAGNVLERTYNAFNLVASETSYTQPDPDGVQGTQKAQGSQVSLYYYDTANGHRRLYFQFAPDGTYTRYVYDDAGNVSWKMEYSKKYTPSSANPPWSEVSAFIVDANQTDTNINAVQYLYVSGTEINRGQVRTEKRYSNVSARAVDQWINVSNTGIAKAEYYYLYDAFGRLYAKADTVANSYYYYDGLNRLTSSKDASGALTTYTYDDAGRKTSIKLANGQTTIQRFDTLGNLIASDVLGAVSQTALGTTQYSYDALGRLRRVTDPTGVSTYTLYDVSGRKSADIAANGQLTEYLYDATGRLIQTIAYATLVTADKLATLVDANGKPVEVALATLRPLADDAQDRIVTRYYDLAGRLVGLRDADGYLTETRYDGASQVTATIAYATAGSVTRLSGASGATLASAPAMALPAADATLDRSTRLFYSSAGRLVGQIDAEGFFTTWDYDQSGNKTRQVRLAQKAGEALRTSGTLTDFLALPKDPDDEVRQWVYDNAGRVIAELDADGHLTEYTYNSADLLWQTKRYKGVALDPVVGASGSVSYATLTRNQIATLVAALGTAEITARTYNSRRLLETETAPDGTITQYVYDNLGRLQTTQRAQGSTEQRDTTVGYDDWGRLKTETDGNAKSLTHSYDAAGRRISTQDRRGNFTYYYYDKAGRLIYRIAKTVDAGGAMVGEVTETLYSNFSEVKTTITHRKTLDLSVQSFPAGLSGGLADAGLIAKINVLADASDNKTNLAYNRRGLIQQAIDALGNKTDTSYNAFGQVDTRNADVDQLGSVPSQRRLATQYTYDRRGLLTKTSQSSASLSAIATRAEYDAFGRQIKAWDGLSQLTQSSFVRDDGQGRKIIVSDAAGSATTVYDAMDRVLTRTDRSSRSVKFAYDVTNRKVTMTTDEGISTVTESNRHGQTVKVTDGTVAITTYAYDNNGNLLTTTDALGNVTQNGYDANNNLSQVIQGLKSNGAAAPTDDGSAITTAYSYDAANRVLTQTVNPGGLNLQTKYEYDGQGRRLKITDPRGTVTTQTFTARGELQDVVVDDVDGGLKLKTSYAYDAQGRTLTVTEGAGTPAARKTAYEYDVLGRRTAEVVDPDGLKLRTSYTYDAAGRVTVKLDALNRATRYRYDAAGRLQFTVDPSGAVIKTSYDGEGRVTATLGYATKLAAGWEARTDVQLDGDLATLTTSTADQFRSYAYDKDGRLAYSLDALGNVTAMQYDKAGRVVLQRQYAKAITLGVAPYGVAEVQSRVTNDDRDRITRTAFDEAGRLRFVIDAEGGVTEYRYDRSGRTTATLNYMQIQDIAGTPTGAQLAAAFKQVNYGFTNDLEGYSGSGGVWEAGQLKMIARPVANGTWADVSSPRTMLVGGGIKFDVTPTQLQQYFLAILHDGSWVPGSLRLKLDPTGKVIAEVQTPQDAYIDSEIGTYTAGKTYTVEIESTRTGGMLYMYEKGGSRDAGLKYSVEGQFNWTKVAAQFAVSRNPALPTESTAYIDNLEERAPRARVTYSVKDAAGRQRYEVDAEGYVTEFELDPLGRTTRTLRYEKRLTFGAAPTLKSLDDPVNKATLGAVISTSRAYDRAGRLDTETDGNNVQTKYTYDAAGRRTAMTQAKGLAEELTTTYAYDSADRLTLKTVAAGKPEQASTQYSYDNLGRIKTETSARGVALLTSTADWANADRSRILGVSVAVGNLTAQQKSALLAAFTTKYDYLDDADGRRTVTTNGLGASTTTYFDAFGNAIRTVDLRGFSGYSYYDKLNRLVLQVDPLGYATATSYWMASSREVASVTRYFQPVALGSVTAPVPTPNAKDATTRNTYDRLGRLLSTQDAELNTESTTYGLNGNRFDKAVTNKLNGRAEFKTDRLDHIVEEALPVSVDGVKVVNRYSYDAWGNRVQSIEAAGLAEQRTTSFKYDGVGRLTHRIGSSITVTDALTGTTSSATPVEFTRYDALGRQVEHIDRGNWVNGDVQGGRRTLNYFNALGFKTAQISADGAAKLFAVDLEGHVTQETALASSVNMASAQASTLPGFTLDATNDRTTVQEFDALGRLLSRARKGVTYWEPDVDGFGLVLGLNVGTVYLERNTYDNNGNLIAQTDAKGSITYHHYDEVGRRILTVDRGGYATTWAYGDVFDTATEQRRYATQVVNPGLQTSVAASRLAIQGMPGSPSADRVQTFELDRLGRVHVQRTLNAATSSVSDAGSVSSQTSAAETQYLYDGLGNVLQKRELATVDGNGAKAYLETNIVYDALGREIHRVAPAALDNTQALAAPTTDTEYNGVGNVRRVTQRGASPTQDRATRFEYNAYGDRTAQVDPMGGRTEYGLNAQGDVVRQTVLAVQQAGGGTRDFVTSYQTDALGRIVWQRDQDTQEVRRTRYSAFGEVTGKGLGSDPNLWQETATYNQLGKVERSNSGDGAQKLYIYDRNGNVTREIQGTPDVGDLSTLTLANAATSTQLNNTFNVYDVRDLLVRSRETKVSFLRDQGSLSAAFVEKLTDWFGAIGETVSGGGQTNGAGVTVQGGGITVSNPAGLSGVATVSVSGSAPSMGAVITGTTAVPGDAFPPAFGKMVQGLAPVAVDGVDYLYMPPGTPPSGRSFKVNLKGDPTRNYRATMTSGGNLQTSPKPGDQVLLLPTSYADAQFNIETELVPGGNVWVTVASATVHVTTADIENGLITSEGYLTLQQGTKVYAIVQDGLQSSATSWQMSIGALTNSAGLAVAGSANTKYAEIDFANFNSNGVASTTIKLLDAGGNVLSDAKYNVSGGVGGNPPSFGSITVNTKPAAGFDSNSGSFVFAGSVVGAPASAFDFFYAESGKTDFVMLGSRSSVSKADLASSSVGLLNGKSYVYYLHSAMGYFQGGFQVGGSGGISVDPLNNASTNAGALQVSALSLPMAVSLPSGSTLNAVFNINGSSVEVPVTGSGFTISSANLQSLLGSSYIGLDAASNKTFAYSYSLWYRNVSDAKVAGGKASIFVGTVEGSLKLGPAGITNVSATAKSAPAWVRIGNAGAGVDVLINGSANAAPRFADSSGTNYWMDLSAFSAGKYTLQYKDPVTKYDMAVEYTKQPAGNVVMTKDFSGGYVGTSTPSIKLADSAVPIKGLNAFKVLKRANPAVAGDAKASGGSPSGLAVSQANGGPYTISWSVVGADIGAVYDFYYSAYGADGSEVAYGTGNYTVESGGVIKQLNFTNNSGAIPGKFSFSFPVTTAFEKSTITINGVKVAPASVNGTVFNFDTKSPPINGQAGHYSYAYEARNGDGVLIGKASGSFDVDAYNFISNVNQQVERTPIGGFVFKGPAGRQDAARIYIRTYKAGAALPSYTPLDGVWTPPVADQPGYMTYLWKLPFGEKTFYAAEDFQFDMYLAKSDGSYLLDEVGDAFKIRGVLTVGESTAKPLTFKRYVGGLNDSAWISHGQTFNAFGEVATEYDDRVANRAQAMVDLYAKSGLWASGTVIDANRERTELSYNTLGKLVSKVAAEAFETLENGQVRRSRAVTQYGYDLLGRMTLEVDANNHTAQRIQYSGAGEDNFVHFAADDGRRVQRTDRLGDKVLTENELGFQTRFIFDQRGQLTELDRLNTTRVKDFASGEFGSQLNNLLGGISKVGSTIVERFQHNALGQRIEHTDAVNGVERTWYDGLGRIVHTQTAGGRDMLYEYTFVAADDAVDPVLGLGGRKQGGYRVRTTENGVRYQIDKIDYFGHTTWHRDYGGHTYIYNYGNSGQLLAQTSSTGQNIAYSYLQNGNVFELKDLAQHVVTRYAYDDAGNRDGESYGQLAPNNTDMADLWQANRIQYDERNRIARVYDSSGGSDAYSENLYKTHDLRYEYDAVGNRRAAIALYWDPLNFTRSLLQRDDHWYTYDVANRFTLTKGSLSGARGAATIVQGSQGVVIGYDKAGQRVSALQANGDLERYSYSSDGYLEDTTVQKFGSATVKQGARRRVDAAGRTVQYLEYSTTDGSLRQNKLAAYDGDNKVLRDGIVDGSLGTQETSYVYADSGKGQLQSTTTTTGNTTLGQSWTYAYWDSAKQASITKTAGNVVSTSTFDYDLNGHLLAVHDSGDPASGKPKRDLQYYIDAQGVILRRSETRSATRFDTLYYYANGRRVGDVSTDPTARDNRISYAELLAQDPKAQPKDKFKDLKPVTSADFDQSYEPINASYPGAAASSYVARTGDTLRSVAQAVWGDGALWYVLAEANALSADTNLLNGQLLVIPNKVTNIHNNASTFRPYSPSEAMGSIDPTAPTPPPPAKGGCGGVGMILMIVVAVVATVLTAGAAAVALGAVGSGAGLVAAGTAVLTGAAGFTAAAIGAAAIGAAVGSIAAQGIGLLTGNVDKFSWKAVGQAAVGGAITAGAGAALNSAAQSGQLGSWAQDTLKTGSSASNLSPGTQVAAAAVRGGTASAANMALHGNWSWRDLGISALSAAAGSAVGGAVSDSGWAQAGGGLGQRFASGLAGSLVARSLSSGRKPAYETVFASSMGNAIGESIATPTTQGQGPWSSADYRNGSDIESDNAMARSDALYGLGGMGVRLGAAPGNFADDWGRQVDRGIRDRSMALQNFDDVSSRVWAGDDAQAAQRYQTMLVRQNARADVYRQQLAREAFNFSDGRDARDIRLSFGYQSRVSRELSDLAAARSSSLVLSRGQISADPGYFTSLSNVLTSDLPLSSKLGMAWDTSKFYFRNNNGMQGAVQSAGGVLELWGAGALTSTGLGTALAVPLAFHGGDNIGTGWRRMFADGDGVTATYSGLYLFTGSRGFASAVDQGIPFLAGVAGAGQAINGLRLGPRPATFANDDLLNAHFEKHGSEFNASSASDYLATGRYVMENGQRLSYSYADETRTGYVSFMRNSRNGESLFAFVGTNEDGFITTIHMKPRTDLFNLLGDDMQSKLKVFRTDTIGPNPQYGWRFPYQP